MLITFTQHAHPVESDLETPVGMFMRLAGEGQGVLFESASPDGTWGRFSVIGFDFLLTATAQNGLLDLQITDHRLQSLFQHHGKPFLEGLHAVMDSLEILPGTGPQQPPITRGLYGYFGYGAAGMFEPRLAHVLPPEHAEASLALPGSVFLFDHIYNTITAVSLRLDERPVQPLPPHVRTLPPNGSNAHAPSPQEDARQTYLNAVTQAQEYIRQGEAIQVVLSTPFSAPLSESPFSLYRRLRASNPSPYMFYMRLQDTVLAGSSPEALISCQENQIRLCPIAGTRMRGQDPVEDILFGDMLLQDPKEQAEHVMLVDLGRNDLSCIAIPGSVHLERFMEVERFSHVMHLTSRLCASLAPGLGSLDVLGAALPAGTVSGAPKIRAMELIASLESAPRGIYAGAAGWLGLDKDAVYLDFGIIIRSLWVQGGHIHWQAGAGIVHGSDPEKEWQECLAKAGAVTKAVFRRRSPTIPHTAFRNARRTACFCSSIIIALLRVVWSMPLSSKGEHRW